VRWSELRRAAVALHSRIALTDEQLAQIVGSRKSSTRLGTTILGNPRMIGKVASALLSAVTARISCIRSTITNWVTCLGSLWPAPIDPMKRAAIKIKCAGPGIKPRPSRLRTPDRLEERERERARQEVQESRESTSWERLHRRRRT